MTAIQRRRRNVLLVLSTVVVITLVAALVVRSKPVFLLNALADAALVTYVYMLVQTKQRTSEERANVRFLASAYREPAAYLTDPRDHLGTSQSSGPRLVPMRQTASR
jgi:hypothetical protein